MPKSELNRKCATGMTQRWAAARALRRFSSMRLRSAARLARARAWARACSAFSSSSARASSAWALSMYCACAAALASCVRGVGVVVLLARARRAAEARASPRCRSPSASARRWRRRAAPRSATGARPRRDDDHDDVRRTRCASAQGYLTGGRGRAAGQVRRAGGAKACRRPYGASPPRSSPRAARAARWRRRGHPPCPGRPARLTRFAASAGAGSRRRSHAAECSRPRREGDDMRKITLAVGLSIAMLGASAAPALAAAGTPQRPDGPVVPIAPSDNGGDNGWGNCGHNSSRGNPHSDPSGGGNGGYKKGDACGDVSRPPTVAVAAARAVATPRRRSTPDRPRAAPSCLSRPARGSGAPPWPPAAQVGQRRADAVDDARVDRQRHVPDATHRWLATSRSGCTSRALRWGTMSWSRSDQ